MREVDGSLRMTVRVKPRASRERVRFLDEDDRAGVDLEVAVNAPPVDGAANARVVELVADALGVSKRAVTVVRGESARVKELAIDGVTVAAVRALLTRR